MVLLVQLVLPEALWGRLVWREQMELQAQQVPQAQRVLPE
jgi:hypothetical protein